MRKVLLGITMFILVVGIVNAQEQHIKPFIRTSKTVYEVGDDIWIEFNIVNIHTEQIKTKGMLKYVSPLYLLINGEKTKVSKGLGAIVESYLQPQETITFAENIADVISNSGIYKLEWKIENIVSDPITIEVVEKE